MRRVLHILTEPDDALAQTLRDLQSAQDDIDVAVADLTVPNPDYDALVEEVFAADSIAVW